MQLGFIKKKRKFNAAWILIIIKEVTNRFHHNFQACCEQIYIGTWLLILDAQLGFSERLSNKHGLNNKIIKIKTKVKTLQKPRKEVKKTNMDFKSMKSTTKSLNLSKQHFKSTNNMTRSLNLLK